jgi:hypothetical protein
MDVAQEGGRVKGLAADVMNSPNPAQAPLRAQIQERQAGVRVRPGEPMRGGQYDRLLADLDELAGLQGRRGVGTLRAIEQERQLRANPAFEQAWKFDTASSPATRQAFAELAGTDAGPRAYQRAMMVARNEMPGYKPPAWESLFDGQGNLAVVPDARFMHFMKMGLDDLHSSAARGETGMGQTVARSIKGVRNNFRDVLKAENKAYGAALDQFAGSMAMQEAVEDGAAAMTKSPDDVAFAFRDLATDSEREAFRIGALTNVINTLGAKRPGPTVDVAAALTSPNFVRKIALLMPDQQAAEMWTRRLDVEGAFSDTARLTGGSRTAPLQELSAQQDADEMAGGIIADVGRGVSGSMWQSMMAALGKVSKPVAAWAKRQRRGATGTMLGQTDQQAEAFLRGLDARPPVIGYQAPRLAAPAAIGAVQGLAGPTPRQRAGYP